MNHRVSLRRRYAWVLPALGALALVAAARAHSAAVDPVAHARAEVRAIGKHWDAQVRDRTAAAYLPMHRALDSSGIRRTADVSYGEHAQQKLDLYAPAQGFDELGPVLVFVHDDALAGGDKVLAGTGELLYGNVARWVARVGGVGINANYRMDQPAGTAGADDDMRRLIEWTRANVARYGGDPQTLLIIGHGGGALRVAGYLFGAPAQSASEPGVAGAILASARFDSPVLLRRIDEYAGKPVPLQLWTADLDPLESGVTALRDRLCARQQCPDIAKLNGHNHASAVMSIDTDDKAAANAIIRFYHSAVHK